jgi:glycosyltransferase involved in cell wall biosynthesis
MSRVRRVLVATDAVGGVWTYSIELARGLRKLGVETVLAVLGPAPGAGQRRDAQGARIVDTGLPLDWVAERPEAIRRSGAELAELAGVHGADLVQLHSAALLADVRFDQPVVAVQHSCVATWWSAVRKDPLPPSFAWQRDLVEAGLNAASAVAAPTAAFAAQTARAYRLGRPVHAVHNGRTPLALTRRRRADSVLTLGRLWDEGKNVDTLDAAAALLDAPVEAIGPLRGANNMVADFEHLRIPGELEADAIAERLSARPIFASAALYEPFGLAALEAAQAGCALVLSDIPTFRELWNGAASFVPARDAQAFANALAQLLRDPDRRDELERAARQRALDYTPEAMARRMLSIYQQVLPEPALGSSEIAVASTG